MLSVVISGVASNSLRGGGSIHKRNPPFYVLYAYDANSAISALIATTTFQMSNQSSLFGIKETITLLRPRVGLITFIVVLFLINIKESAEFFTNFFGNHDTTANWLPSSLCETTTAKQRTFWRGKIFSRLNLNSKLISSPNCYALTFASNVPRCRIRGRN